jgi:hypothetical protein
MFLAFPCLLYVNDYHIFMNMWFWKSKGQSGDVIKKKMEEAMKNERFVKFPADIRQLDDSYRALIKELAKR